MPNEPKSNAGVKFPPPLIFLLALIAALLINRTVRLPLAAPEPRWMWFLGVALLVVGFLFAGWGVATFRRHHTAIAPIRPATTIVNSGPYAITRNPMYVGLTCQYIGVAFLLDTWWAFIFLPIVVLIVDRQVIGREERYLASAFGAQYESYRAGVRRWI